MTAFDTDPNGYLPIVHAVVARLRAIARSRAWRNASDDTCCA